jgi:hypothetical protein
MKTIRGICGLVAVLSMIQFVGHVNAVAADETVAEKDKHIEDKAVAEQDMRVGESRIVWNKFLAANCSDNDTEQTIRKLMDGKYRELAPTRSNNETHGLLYRIDDFHEVRFAFYDKNSRLMFTPRVEPKGQWVRMPDGFVKSTRTLAETRLQLKLAEVALEYVMKHTHRQRDSLSVSCMRSAEAHTWDVVVSVKTLQVDAPSYILEMTNEGAIIKGPFDNDDASKKAK